MILQATIKKMQDPLKGIPIKTVSTFMYKIPSVFSGNIFALWNYLTFKLMFE